MTDKYIPRNQIIAQQDSERVKERYNYILNQVKEYNKKGQSQIVYIFMRRSEPLRIIRKILNLASKNGDVKLYKNDIDEECVEYIKEVEK
jgi:hypothetical protein